MAQVATAVSLRGVLRPHGSSTAQNRETNSFSPFSFCPACRQLLVFFSFAPQAEINDSAPQPLFDAFFRILSPLSPSGLRNASLWSGRSSSPPLVFFILRFSTLRGPTAPLSPFFFSFLLQSAPPAFTAAINRFPPLWVHPLFVWRFLLDHSRICPPSPPPVPF